MRTVFAISTVGKEKIPTLFVKGDSFLKKFNVKYGYLRFKNENVFHDIQKAREKSGVDTNGFRVVSKKKEFKNSDHYAHVVVEKDGKQYEIELSNIFDVGFIANVNGKVIADLPHIEKLTKDEFEAYDLAKTATSFEESMRL
mgnify:CR=1 FL=1